MKPQFVEEKKQRWHKRSRNKQVRLFNFSLYASLRKEINLKCSIQVLNLELDCTQMHWHKDRGKYLQRRQHRSHGADLQTSVLEVTIHGLGTYSPLRCRRLNPGCRISYLGCFFGCHDRSSGFVPQMPGSDFSNSVALPLSSEGC